MDISWECILCNLIYTGIHVPWLPWSTVLLGSGHPFHRIRAHHGHDRPILLGFPWHMAHMVVVDDTTKVNEMSALVTGAGRRNYRTEGTPQSRFQTLPAVDRALSHGPTASASAGNHCATSSQRLWRFTDSNSGSQTVQRYEIVMSQYL